MRARQDQTPCFLSTFITNQLTLSFSVTVLIDLLLSMLFECRLVLSYLRLHSSRIR